MPTAQVKLGPPLSEACPNCGELQANMVAVIRNDDDKIGWKGCERCWPKIKERGQLNTVRQMVREVGLPRDPKRNL